MKRLFDLESYIQSLAPEIYQSDDSPSYVQPSPELSRAFGTLQLAQIPLLFHGHTHCQTVWTLANNRISRNDAVVFKLKPKQFYIVGVGSVGEPKDNVQPSYTLYDTDTNQVQLVRVELNVPLLYDRTPSGCS